MKKILAVAAVVALTVCTFLTAASAEAKTKLAGATYVYLDSDPGDVIGGGMTHVVPVSPSKMRLEGHKNINRLFIDAYQGEHWLHFFLENPAGRGFTTGVHRFAAADESQYQLSISGFGPNCGAVDGTLDIRQLSYDHAGKISRFDMSYTATCRWDGSGSARGRIAYRSTKKVEAPSTESVLRGGETLYQGRELVNVFGAEGALSYGEAYHRLVVRDGQALLIRRVWPDTYSRDYTDTIVWSTPTHGSAGDHLAVRGDGSLALLTPAGKAVWSIKPSGSAHGDFLTIDNDGTLLLTTPRYKRLWSVG